MAESKSRLLYILKYLWQNTDAEHYATTADILAFLKGNGISCDRKTIPGDIAKLCDIGIDIEEERSRENRYSLSSVFVKRKCEQKGPKKVSTFSTRFHVVSNVFPKYQMLTF